MKKVNLNMPNFAPLTATVEDMAANVLEAELIRATINKGGATLSVGKYRLFLGTAVVQNTVLLIEDVE